MTTMAQASLPDPMGPRQSRTGNPVFLVRADGHGAVANSAALKLAGITRATRSPEGGEIMRDATTGEPNGMVLDKAQSLIADKHAVPADQRKVKDPRLRIEDAQIFSPDDLPRPVKLGVVL